MTQQVRALAVKFPTLTSKLGRDSSLGQKKKSIQDMLIHKLQQSNTKCLEASHQHMG